MSFHPGSNAGASPVHKVTHWTLREKKQRGEPITALTAYDYPTARLIDEAGLDVILVGDSVAMAVLGYDSTLPLTMDEMLHHAKAVRRGTRRSLLVVDMPYGSYHVNDDDAVRNAIRLVQQGGAEAVKLEGGAQRAALVARLTEAEVPVMGHIGLTPQSVYRMGGYRVQGKTLPAIQQLMHDAAALEAAGAIALVLEGVPREVAAKITAAAGIPTIGIGAGPECDGQILVFHDLAQLGVRVAGQVCARLCGRGRTDAAGLEEYRHAVETRTFPSDAESYHLPPQVRAELEQAELVTV